MLGLDLVEGQIGKRRTIVVESGAPLRSMLWVSPSQFQTRQQFSDELGKGGNDFRRRRMRSILRVHSGSKEFARGYGGVPSLSQGHSSRT